MLSWLILAAGLCSAAEIALPPHAPNATVEIASQMRALAVLPAGPSWAPSAISLLAAPAAAPASARLAAEALARPELLPALPGGAKLIARVEAIHADPAARRDFLERLAPLRAPDDPDAPPAERLERWRKAFDGGRRDESPVLEKNFPGMLYAYGDPAALKAGRRVYAAATSNNAPDSGPIVRSDDGMKTWALHGFLFPRERRPAWHDQSPDRYDFWAPELHRVGGRFVAYYTARDVYGELRIGAAWAKRIGGPWTDLGRPLISDPRVGLIDSHHFRDPATGKHYLYWKKDGNGLSPKEKTTVYVSELAPDGLSLVGERREVLENDQPWEDDLVEGQWMIKRGGWYYLFYSGNNYTTNRYAMGVARSRSPLGPFEKSPERLLSSGGLFEGPGHCSILRGAGGKLTLVYHAYRPGQAGYRKDRLLRADPIVWLDGWPRVGNGFPAGVPPLPRPVAAR